MLMLTGADGFIGKRLFARLRDLEVACLPIYLAPDPALTDVAGHLDLSQASHLKIFSSLPAAPSVVVHLAGRIEIILAKNEKEPFSHPVPGNENILEIYRHNLTATVNLVDFCLKQGVKRLIFASTQAVYGMPVEEPLTEESPIAPLEHYAASKWCAEQVLKMAARQGLGVTVLRFPGVYGEGRQSGVVYNFCKAALTARQIMVKADFPLPLDVIHIEDVVNALVQAVNYRADGWQCFNIATGEPCNLALLAEAVAALVPGCTVVHQSVPQPVVRLDPSRARSALGWQAKPRSERLQGMLEHLRDRMPTVS